MTKPTLLSKPCLAVLVGIFALVFWQCAPRYSAFSSRKIDANQDSTLFPVQAKPGHKCVSQAFFQSFQSSTGWKFTAPSPSWILSENGRTEKGIPVWTLVQESDRKVRLTFYETSFPKGTFKGKQLVAALAYLFKAEPDSISALQPLKPYAGMLFKPVKDTLRHWGQLYSTDTSLLFIHFESKDPVLGGNVGQLPGIQVDAFNRVSVKIPDSSSKSFRGALENTLGLRAIEDSNWQTALKHFQLALSLDSTHAPYLINSAAIFQLRKDNLGGIECLGKYPHLLANSPDLAGIMGSMYEELGQFQDAKTWALKALDGDPKNMEWLINLSDALWGLGERVHSKNVLLHRYSEQPNFRISVYLASTLLGLEEFENARQVLVATHQDSAPSPKSSEYYLRALVGLKKYEEALNFIRELGEKFPVTANNFLFKGICEFNLKLYRLAALSAKEALGIEAGNREAQHLATQIAALMGSRSNLILRTPISPLKTKATLAEAQKVLDKGENKKLATQGPLTLINQHIVYTWVPKGRWKKTRHQFFYIPDTRKLIRLSELTYEINPTYSRFFVNTFRLYDAMHKIVEVQKASDFYVTKSHNTTLHPENLLVHLPIKTRPGILFLEVMTTEESQLPVPEFPYLRYDNAFPFPILQCKYELIHAPKNLLVSPFGEAKLDSLPDRLVIQMSEPVAGLEDDFRPANDEFGTGFSATPFTTWRDIGANYHQLLTKAGIHTDSIPLRIQERAQEVMDGNRGSNPVKALFQYVRDSVRYNNYEFSLQALVPDKSESVLTHGHSDCKGHALLLLQMLKARKIKAHLCLVSLTHSGDLDQPSLDQFNHMIVQVPAQQGWPEYFLDPTEKKSAFRRSPLALENKNGLIVDPENSRMATIPELDSIDEHRVQIFHKLKVDANQSALGEDSLVLSGKVAADFRNHMQQWNQTTKYENLLSWLAQSYPSFGDERFRVLNEADAEAPLIIVFKYRRKFPFLSQDYEFEHFPKLELSFLRFPKAATRKAPIYFPHEIQISSEWIYEIPPEYGWKSLNLDREIQERYLHWLLSIKQTAPEAISIKQNWRIEPFVAEPVDYAKIQAEWDPILLNAGLKLVISKQGQK